MAIVLRTVTGSALTHTQVDTNFASFYYSSSLTGQILTLFTTGSTAIGQAPTSTSYTIPSASKWTDMAGGGITRNSFVSITGSFAQGHSTNIATGTNSHAQGRTATATDSNSHAEGEGTTASGQASHAEGNSTSASAYAAHAEGISTNASGYASHAEGSSTTASRTGSHAEGSNTSASGDYSHAEGNFTIASGSYSHAEGQSTQAIGSYSHAEGQSTQAIGTGSHAQGLGTIALGNYQHVQGRHNITSSVESAFIIGNGANSSNKSNLVFTSGSTFQVSGSLLVSGSTIISDNLTVSGSTTILGSMSMGSDVVNGSITITANRPYLLLRRPNDDTSLILNAGDTTVSASLDVLNQQFFEINTTKIVKLSTDKKERLTVNQNGGIVINSGSLSTAPIVLQVTGSSSFTGSVSINDILSLTRRTTTPTPTEGMIIASGSAGASVLYYYNGTSWNALF